jgi:hypothetical protein
MCLPNTNIDADLLQATPDVLEEARGYSKVALLSRDISREILDGPTTISHESGTSVLRAGDPSFASRG